MAFGHCEQKDHAHAQKTAVKQGVKQVKLGVKRKKIWHMPIDFKIRWKLWKVDCKREADRKRKADRRRKTNPQGYLIVYGRGTKRRADEKE